jgi:hypothetical protein
MARETIREALLSVLQEIQICSGRGFGELDENTCPREDLPGFTSVNCVEVAALLSGKLGYKVAPRVILAKHGGNHPTIGQLLDRLCPND